MLSKSALFLGALCASATSYAASVSVPALYPHVPLVFWSNRATFNTNDAYLSSVLNEKEVASVLKVVVTADADKDIYNILNQEYIATTRAEALCVFVHGSLRSEELAQFGKDSFLKSAVKTSTSSVVVPHTTRSSSLTRELKGLNAVVISIDDVGAWITSAKGKAALNNAETDLVVVEIPEQYTIAQVDRKIQNAAEALQTATGGLTDFALTGAEAAPLLIEDPYTRRLQTTTDIICDVGYLIGTSSTGKAFCFSHFVHMTPEILTALIFGFFFLFLAYVGVSVLHAIQTPLYYPSQGPPKGKEF